MGIESRQIEACFFISPVRAGGKVFAAPKDAVEYYKELGRNYLDNSPLGTGTTVCINLRPKYKEFRQGWLVEAVLIEKPKVKFIPSRIELLN